MMDRREVLRQAAACAAEIERSGDKIARAARALKVDLNGDDMEAALLAAGILSTTIDGTLRMLGPLAECLRGLTRQDGGQA